ncbi:glycosyl hydrolase [Oxalobacteraceae bacterium]|nr:glycosyl hydrolase [Oxalobacteraceae bacterium]
MNHNWNQQIGARFRPLLLPSLPLLLPLLLAGAPVGAANGNALVSLNPAVSVAHATQASMLAATWAGKRGVAVGAHGIVLLSDDQGKSWRQARKVPLDVTLTAVSFASEQEGWAVGHAGVVLHTMNGGEEWEVQRSKPEQDRPLFGVHFFDKQHGVAVGLWSLVLTTSDGGRQWTERQLEAPPGGRRADLNLFGLFTGPGGALYAPAEKGYVLHSADQGLSWTYLATGYRGSFWTGVALPDGTLLVGGLRGALYRRASAASNISNSNSGGGGGGAGIPAAAPVWSRISTGSTASIASLAALGNGGSDASVLAVGLDGLTLRSEDNGMSFRTSYRQDRLPLQAILPLAGHATALLSARGPVPVELRVSK